jgi:hypothetical protein
MPEDVEVAESSTAPSLDTLDPEQYAEWRASGKMPEAPTEAESASADTSATGAPKAPAETAPASDPAKPQEQAKPKGAESRKAELAAEIQDLLKKRRELRDEVERGVKPAAQPPAAAPAAVQDPEPIFNDILAKAASYEDAVQEFQRAHGKWMIRQDRSEQDRKARERTASEQRDIFLGKVEKATAAHEDFEQVVSAATDLTFDSPTGLAMKEAIDDSELPGELVYHLAKNPSEFHRIAKLSPVKAIRELGKIEETLAGTTAPTNGASGTASAPVLRKQTNAPAPITVLAAKNTAPTDEAFQAVKDDDFTRFKQLEDARELKKLRRA